MKHNIKLKIDDRIIVSKTIDPTIVDHSQIRNLDFENSGHTGFASQESVDELNVKVNYLEADINALQTKTQSLYQSIKYLQIEDEALFAAMDKLANDVTNILQTEIQQIKWDLEDLKTILTNLSVTDTYIWQEIVYMSNIIQSLETGVNQRIDDEVARLEDKIDNIDVTEQIEGKVEIDVVKNEMITSIYRDEDNNLILSRGKYDEVEIDTLRQGVMFGNFQDFVKHYFDGSYPSSLFNNIFLDMNGAEISAQIKINVKQIVSSLGYDESIVLSVDVPYLTMQVIYIHIELNWEAPQEAADEVFIKLTDNEVKTSKTDLGYGSTVNGVEIATENDINLIEDKIDLLTQDIYNLTAIANDVNVRINDLEIDNDEIKELVQQLLIDVADIYDDSIPAIKQDIYDLRSMLNTISDVDLSRIYDMLDDMQAIIDKLDGTDITEIKSRLSSIENKVESLDTKISGNFDYLNLKVEQRATIQQLEVVRQLILGKIKIEIVDELPVENIDFNTIYLIKDLDAGNALQWMFSEVTNDWVQLGTTEVDLSDVIKQGDNANLNSMKIEYGDAKSIISPSQAQLELAHEDGKTSFKLTNEGATINDDRILVESDLESIGSNSSGFKKISHNNILAIQTNHMVRLAKIKVDFNRATARNNRNPIFIRMSVDGHGSNAIIDYNIILDVNLAGTNLEVNHNSGITASTWNNIQSHETITSPFWTFRISTIIPNEEWELTMVKTSALLTNVLVYTFDDPDHPISITSIDDDQIEVPSIGISNIATIDHTIRSSILRANREWIFRNPERNSNQWSITKTNANNIWGNIINQLSAPNSLGVFFLEFTSPALNKYQKYKFTLSNTLDNLKAELIEGSHKDWLKVWIGFSFGTAVNVYIDMSDVELNDRILINYIGETTVSSNQNNTLTRGGSFSSVSRPASEANSVAAIDNLGFHLRALNLGTGGEIPRDLNVDSVNIATAGNIYFTGGALGYQTIGNSMFTGDGVMNALRIQGSAPNLQVAGNIYEGNNRVATQTDINSLLQRIEQLENRQTREVWRGEITNGGTYTIQLPRPLRPTDTLRFAGWNLTIPQFNTMNSNGIQPTITGFQLLQHPNALRWGPAFNWQQAAAGVGVRGVHFEFAVINDGDEIRMNIINATSVLSLQVILED